MKNFGVLEAFASVVLAGVYTPLVVAALTWANIFSPEAAYINDMLWRNLADFIGAHTTPRHGLCIIAAVSWATLVQISAIDTLRMEEAGVSQAAIDQALTGVLTTKLAALTEMMGTIDAQLPIAAEMAKKCPYSDAVRACQPLLDRRDELVRELKAVCTEIETLDARLSKRAPSALLFTHLS